METTCKHCGRAIQLDIEGLWIDPEAGGDDLMWRETCDAHDTFLADHEPAVGMPYCRHGRTLFEGCRECLGAEDWSLDAFAQPRWSRGRRVVAAIVRALVARGAAQSMMRGRR